MIWKTVKERVAYWWSEGYLSWDGIAILIGCILIGVLYYYNIINSFMLLSISGLLVVAAELVGYRTSKAHGRTFDAAMCLIFAIIYLLLNL